MSVLWWLLLDFIPLKVTESATRVRRVRQRFGGFRVMLRAWRHPGTGYRVAYVLQLLQSEAGHI